MKWDIKYEIENRRNCSLFKFDIFIDVKLFKNFFE